MGHRAIAYAVLLAAAAGGTANAGVPPAAVDKLKAMRKAADALDEAANPAAYRTAWMQALDYAATLYPPGHPELAVVESELVSADYFQGNVTGALERSQKLIAALQKAGPAYATQVTDLMNGAMVMLMTLGRHAEARTLGAEILARRQAQYGDRPHSELAAAYSNHANAEFEYGHYDDAIRLSRKAIGEARRLNPVPANAAVWMSNLPVYLGAAGRLNEAILTARDTATDLESFLPKDHPFLASNLNTLARFQLQMGRPGEAAETARRAMAIAHARFGEKQQTAAYMTTLAQALLADEKAEEAKGVAEGAARILERDLGAEADRTLVAKEAVAATLAAAGEPQAALNLRRSILDARQRKLPAFHRDRIGGADRLAVQALKVGAIEEARRVQADAQQLRAAANIPADDLARLSGETRLGAIEVRSGERQAGLARVQTAIALLERRLEQAQAAELLHKGQDLDARSVYGWALDAAAGASETELAFRYAQGFMRGQLERTAEQGAIRRSVPADLAEWVREKQDAAAGLERLLDRRLRAAARGADAAATESFEQERARLERRYADANAALAGRIPAIQGAPLELDQAKASLARDEALLLVAPGEMRTIVFALSRDRVAMVETDGADQVRALVSKVRASIAPDAEARGEAFAFGAAGDLHAMLFPTAIQAVTGSRPRLLVSTSGSLSTLPFALLAGQQRSSSAPDWLIERHALVTLPSLRTILEKRNRTKTGAKAQFVGIGAPTLDGTAAEGAALYRSAGLSRQVRELPPLATAGAELRAMADALGAPDPVILTGAVATEAAVRRAGALRAELIAFATHGVQPGELDGLDEPALVLTPSGDDGLLTDAEIAELRIAADWIVLSACNSAGGSGNGEGLTGLARAFLHAGGRNLLASHWPVRDDAAAYLSVQSVRNWRGGDDPAQALRRAALAMIKNKPVAGADHPRHWAAFAYIGR